MIARAHELANLPECECDVDVNVQVASSGCREAPAAAGSAGSLRRPC